MPSAQIRSPYTPFEDLPGHFPDGTLRQRIDLEGAARTSIRKLNDLKKTDLVDSAIWRDALSFTDTFRTFHGDSTVYATLDQLSRRKQRSHFRLTEGSARRTGLPGTSHRSPSAWLDVNVECTVHEGDLVGIVGGIVSVISDANGNFKVWMIRTWLERYEGHGDPDHLEPASITGSGTGVSEQEANGSIVSASEHIYHAIIVGGGQAGLSTAGRLRALGMDYKLFDDRKYSGDAWGDRYDSLKWHTVREYGNLPFGRTWTDSDPSLLPKDRIGSGHREWAERYGINRQQETKVTKASWDEATSEWTVLTQRTFDQSIVEKWRSKNLVLCPGPGHKRPSLPDWATPERVKASKFEGTIRHGLHYRNVKGFEGMRGIVVGTANTGHDVAMDMVDANMETTMIQRSATFVFPGQFLESMQNMLYTTDVPTHISDRQATMPVNFQREMINRGAWNNIAERKEFLDDLEAAGFRLDRYGDLYKYIFTKFGGHYVDIGNCQNIIDGKVKVKGGLVKCLTENGLLMEDGTEIKADLIVLATGFIHDFRADAAEIIGEENADLMDDYWGADPEGEIRGYAKLAGHPALYYHGGDVRLGRFMSRFVALQIQRQVLGRPLQPYLEGQKWRESAI